MTSTQPKEDVHLSRTVRGTDRASMKVPVSTASIDFFMAVLISTPPHGNKNLLISCLFLYLSIDGASELFWKIAVGTWGRWCRPTS